MVNKSISKDSIKVVVDAIIGNDEKSQEDSRWQYLKNKYIKGSENIIERFLVNFFRLTEGSFACADKAKFVVKQIYKSLELNEYQPLIERYGKNDIGAPEDEITYWSPLGFESTKEAIDLIDAYFTFSLDLFKKLFEEFKKVSDKNWGIKYLNKIGGEV